MAEKSEIIAALRAIAELLEFRGENQFKSRAYENAARALANDTTPLEELASHPALLVKIPGIGKATAEVISEVANTGESEYLKQLQEGTPAGISELMRIPNLGPKKIKLLFDTLNIQTVEELEKSCREGALNSLKGLGQKTADKILAGIEQFRRFRGNHPFFRAYRRAVPLLEYIQSSPAVIRAELAGSIRRRKEIISDIDIIASSENAKAVMDYFIAAPGVTSIIAAGDTKTSVFLGEEMQVDLRVVKDDEFAAALHYFTGSKEHNTQVRARAIKAGLRVNEYGIFRNPAKRSRRHIASNAEMLEKEATERLPIKTEQEFFRALELDYIPPELREGNDEINCAAEGKLPRLITRENYAGVIHVHSTWSDGTSSIRELAIGARDLGLQYLAICDHSEVATYARGVKKADIPRQHAEIDDINSTLASDEFRVLKSCECDILADGTLDYPDAILAKMDLVVASVHSRFQQSEEEMTQRILRAIDNPYTTIIGHLTGRLLLSRDPYKLDIETVLRRATETGTVIEINADPHRLDLDWRYCKHAKEMGVRFAVNPDAHDVLAFSYIDYGINIARKGWLTKEDVINCLPLNSFLEFVSELRAQKLKRHKLTK
jgi:DNA polymerase (family 10)